SIIFLWPYLLISNLITPIGTIMGERLMYFPSAGICLIISNFILNLFSNKMSKIYRFFAIVVLLSFSIFYIIRTYIRNFDWKDQTTLFISAAKVSPNSVLSRSNLGAVYLLSGDYIRAEKEILAANKIYPYYPPAVNNLGLIYKWKKDYKKAEELFIKAINIAGYPPAVENLALVYFEQGRFKEAKEMLKIFFQNDQTKVQNYLFSLFYNKIQQALKQGDQKLVKELQKKAEEILNKD
ncbi:MAG: tetratricopeptide repeat protein, partial [Endomicrobiia bacterium]